MRWIRLSMVSAVFGLACGSDDSASDPADGGTTGGASTGSASTSQPDDGQPDTGSTGESDPDTTAGAETSEADSTSDGATTEGTAVCGNGRVERGEVCDDGVNDWDYNGCADDCSQLGPHCGDGEFDREHGEMCDLGDRNGNAQCNVACLVPGTILGSVYDDTVDTPSLGGEPMEALIWNGRVTLVTTVGNSTVVWELDDETIETADLRELDEDDGGSPILGATALGNGHLLLASVSGFAKRALIVDESLALQWEYSPIDNAASESFVGAATTSTGAILGANHRSPNAMTPVSSYWTIGISDSGMIDWQEIEEAGDGSVNSTDLHALGGDRAVQAFHIVGDPGAAAFRIFDADGQVLAEDVIPQLSSSAIDWEICNGQDAFFLFNRSISTLTGFDADGAPTFDAIVSGTEFNSRCVTRGDGSPVVVSNAIDEDAFSSTMTVHGFDQATQIYEIGLDATLSYGDQPPALLLDEERSRLWVFHTGRTAIDGGGFLYAAVVAI